MVAVRSPITAHMAHGAEGGTRAALPTTGNGHTCPCQAVGLDFFRSVVAAYRAGQLSRYDARRFVTNFLESKANSVSSRLKRRTGQCDQVY